MDNDDDIDSWATIALGLIASVFFFIGLMSVVAASCMAWGYYTYEPICGSIAALFTSECKLT
jgi:hypothetical protein